jgi:hypothetical protein
LIRWNFLTGCAILPESKQKTEEKQMLLNIDRNAKTVKGQKKGYLTGILYLAPSNLSGYNVCPFAKVAGCEAACLNTAGRGQMNMVQKSRIRKTRMFHENREAFMAELVKDVNTLIRRATKRELIPVVRLNGTSDIIWEKVGVGVGGVWYDNIMGAFPEVQFYDYTKYPKRNVPKNYHITFSYSPVYGKKSDHNMAVVFKKHLPVTYLGRKVINGDENDLRFLDKRNVIVGLKAKGKAKNDSTGFVVEN